MTMTATTTLTIEPVTPTIGAEISGVDLRAPLDEAARTQIWQAVLDHKAIFFRDQPMTTAEYVAFASQFGELEDDQLGPKADGFVEVESIYRDETEAGAENLWHCHGAYRKYPPGATFLRIVQMPGVGGDTLFADMAAAYDGLPADLRERLDGLTAVHDFTFSFFRETGTRSAKARGAQLMRRLGPIFGQNEEHIETMAKFPPSTHPVVRVHPETGRRSIYVTPNHTVRIEGLPDDESKALLKLLYAQASVPEYQCRFRWSEHAIAVWDERTVHHYGVSDYYPQRRELHRARVRGTEPVVGPRD